MIQLTVAVAQQTFFAPSKTAHDALRSKFTDWSGLWFKMVEADYGEFVGMRGGRRTADGEMSWIFPSHAKHDGLGGFVHVLRETFADREFRVPERKIRKPSWSKRSRSSIC